MPSYYVDVACCVVYYDRLIETFDFQNICITNQIFSSPSSEAVVVIIVVLKNMIYMILFQNYLGTILSLESSSYNKRSRILNYMLLSHCLYRLILSDYPFEWLFYQHSYIFYDDQFEGYCYESIKYMCIYFMKDIYLYRWNYRKQTRLLINNHVSK